MAITQTISTIPDAGHRGVDARDTFVTKQEAFQDALTDTFVGQINTFATQANTLETNVNAKEATVVAKEALVNPHYTAIDGVYANISSINTNSTNITAIQNASANATSAANSATAAAASAANAASTSNVTKWISGTTYAEGDCVWSPTDYQTYRRKSAGGGTTDPLYDDTNWSLLTSSTAIVEW